MDRYFTLSNNLGISYDLASSPSQREHLEEIIIKLTFFIFYNDLFGIIYLNNIGF